MIKRKIGKFYAKIIGILLKPFLKLFREALHEELIYIKKPSEYYGNQMEEAFQKFVEAEIEKDKENEKKGLGDLIANCKN